MKRYLFVWLLVVSSLFASDRFVRDDANEVVVDTQTNLMWQDNSDAKTVTNNWGGAINYCESLTLGGHSDWRLPNYNELFGLTDRSRYNPAIDPTFQNVVSNYYWSSTTISGDTSGAWDADFYRGGDYWDVKPNSNYVRCVRDNN